MNKVCKTCKTLKPIEKFYRAKDNKDGLQGSCKACRNQKIEESRKIYQHREPGGYRRVRQDISLRRRYGITVDEYEAMLKQQRGVCAICLQECTSGKSLAVDHCHKTGKVRGLLCAACNVSLGKFKDSTALLESAIKYLKEHQNA